jgi:hypothetical protein
VTLRFAPDGTITTIYSEAIDLAALGAVQIERASHVEPTDDARWTADLAPVGGPVLGPFARRSEALAAEIEWLDRWLSQ